MGVRKIFANKDIDINHHDPDTTATDYFKITTAVDSTCSVNDRIFYISKFIQLIHIHFTDVAFAAASNDTDNRKSNNRPKSKNLKKRNSSALSSLSSSLPHLPSLSTSSDSGEDFVFDESAAKVVSNLHSNDTITHCRYRRRDCHIYHHCRCCLSHNRDNDANDGGIDVHSNTNCESNTESFKKKSTVVKNDAAQKYDCDDNDNGNDDYTTTTVKPTNARSSSFVFKRKKRHASVERRRYSQTLSSIHVDRPFMFHVCTEFSTNVPFVLFSGCVVNPNITVRTSH